MIKNWLDSLPQVTRHLLIINVILFLFTIVLEQKGIFLERKLSVYYPYSPFFAPYQFFTYLFMHSSQSWTHILFNMIALLGFGTRIEYVLGSKRFLTYYFLCGIGCLLIYFGIHYIQIAWLFHSVEIPQQAQKQLLYFISQDLSIPAHLQALSIYLDGQDQLGFAVQKWMPIIIKINQMINTPLLGASGAIYGVLFAFAYYFPNERLLLLFPPIPVKAKYLVAGLFIFSLLMGLQNNPLDNTAHWAHLAGIIVGWLVLLFWRQKRKGNKNFFY